MFIIKLKCFLLSFLEIINNMSIEKINPYVVGYLEFAYSNYQEELPEDRFLWDEYWNDQFLFDTLGNAPAFCAYISPSEFWKEVDITRAMYYINSYYSSEYGEHHILQWRDITLEYLQIQYATVYCYQNNEALKLRIIGQCQGQGQYADESDGEKTDIDDVD